MKFASVLVDEIRSMASRLMTSGGSVTIAGTGKMTTTSGTRSGTTSGMTSGRATGMRDGRRIAQSLR